MASDKHALVIDNGSDTIKAGFSCKNQPQVIIPSLVGQPRPKFLNHITFNPNLKDRYVGNEAQVNRDILELSHPIENGLIKQWDDMEKVWKIYSDLIIRLQQILFYLTDLYCHSCSFHGAVYMEASTPLTELS